MVDTARRMQHQRLKGLFLDVRRMLLPHILELRRNAPLRIPRRRTKHLAEARTRRAHRRIGPSGLHSGRKHATTVDAGSDVRAGLTQAWSLFAKPAQVRLDPRPFAPRALAPRATSFARRRSGHVQRLVRIAEHFLQRLQTRNQPLDVVAAAHNRLPLQLVQTAHLLDQVVPVRWLHLELRQRHGLRDRNTVQLTTAREHNVQTTLVICPATLAFPLLASARACVDDETRRTIDGLTLNLIIGHLDRVLELETLAPHGVLLIELGPLARGLN
mmetsp:Transcript_28615/g.66436  ORF Transcript_28615/g.66436 Transcript_28615/m.66436 type:complete len:272 (-) Transcript_28615:254-1069(-)